MEASSLTTLMVELFAAIKLLSGYPSPAVLPEVQRMSQAQIQQKLCDGRHCHIKAFYHPQWGVIVDDALDFQNDPFDRSILLHELVHHLQNTTGRFDSYESFCSRRTAEEFEAYAIQNRYLSSIHASRRALAMGWSGKCENDSSEHERKL
jgi:hypothetical protein